MADTSALQPSRYRKPPIRKKTPRRKLVNRIKRSRRTGGVHRKTEELEKPTVVSYSSDGNADRSNKIIVQSGGEGNQKEEDNQIHTDSLENTVSMPSDFSFSSPATVKCEAKDQVEDNQDSGVTTLHSRIALADHEYVQVYRFPPQLEMEVITNYQSKYDLQLEEQSTFHSAEGEITTIASHHEATDQRLDNYIFEDIYLEETSNSGINSPPSTAPPNLSDSDCGSHSSRSSSVVQPEWVSVPGQHCEEERPDSHSSNHEVEPSDPMSPEACALMDKVQLGLLRFLPHSWVVFMRKNGICVCLPAPSPTIIVVQRALIVEPSGRVYASVHGKKLDSNHASYKTIGDKIPALSGETVAIFIKDILRLVDRFRMMETCKGVEDFQPVWKTLQGSVIDTNPFLESRYATTCRPLGCHLLVPSLRHRRCAECVRAHALLQKRLKVLPAGSPATPSSKKPYHLLTSAEKKKLYDSKRKEIQNLKKSNRRLKVRVRELLQKDGIAAQ